MHLGWPAANTGTLLMKGPPMNDEKTTAAQPPSEPSVWLDIADELERIAKDCRDLVGESAPAQFELNIQPGSAIAEAVDSVAATLVGAATVKTVGNLRTARGWRGPISFSVYRALAAVNPAEELARLREENARLRAAAGLDHSRDEPADAPAGRIPPHLEDGRCSPECATPGRSSPEAHLVDCPANIPPTA